MRLGECGAAGRWAQRATDQVRLARWIGERAVRMARDGVVAAWVDGATVVASTSPAEQAAEERPDETTHPRAAAADVDASTRPTGEGATTSTGEAAPAQEIAEPFDGYDALAATHIVQRMSRLSILELSEIRGYEVTHRARRTIVAKVDQLLGERPGS